MAGRNPRLRAWVEWNPSNSFDIVDHTGRSLRMSYHVESVMADIVTFAETKMDCHGKPLRVNRWSWGPLTATSKDIIAVASAS